MVSLNYTCFAVVTFCRHLKVIYCSKSNVYDIDMLLYGWPTRLVLCASGVAQKISSTTSTHNFYSPESGSKKDNQLITHEKN